VSGKGIKSENLGRRIRNSKENLREKSCASKSGYKLYGKKYCYRVSTDKVYWDSAYEACENENTHLVIINNQNEFDTIRKFSSDLADYWVLYFLS